MYVSGESRTCSARISIGSTDALRSSATSAWGSGAMVAKATKPEAASTSTAAPLNRRPSVTVLRLKCIEFRLLYLSSGESSKEPARFKPTMTPIQQAIETIRRGCHELIVQEELEKKLATGRKLRI